MAPKLTLAVKLTKATTITLTLTNAQGHVVATWTEKAKAGSTKLSLLIPVKARKAGGATLRITPKGGKSMTQHVVLRA